MRVGVLAATLAFAALGAAHALVIPPYLPPDEPAHLGYVLALRDGELPTIDTPIRAGWSPLMDAVVRAGVGGIGPHRGDVYVANHPPLLYALAAGPVVLGARVGDPETGLRLGRLTSVLLASSVVVATAALAANLVPGRPVVVVTAAWFAALLPLMAHVSAFFYTDGLAVATFTGALAACAWLLRRGWSPGRAGVVAALGALATASRVSGLAAAGACGVAVLLAACLSGGEGLRRAGRAVAGAGAMVGAVAASSGWFYARNVARYGDVTAADALMEKVGRAVPEPFLAPLRSSTTWVLWTRDYFDGFAGDVKPFHGTPWRGLTWVVVGLLAAAVVVLVVRAFARASSLRVEMLAPWVPAVAAVAVLAVGIVRFILVGGGLHPRYALGGLGLAATIVACAVAGLPGRERTSGPVALVATMLVMHVAALVGFAAATA